MNGAAQGAQQGAPQGGQMPQGGFGQGGPPGGGHGLGMLPGGPTTSIVLIALFVVTLIVLTIAFYTMFQKAGMAGALGLLMLIPVLNLGVALYLAFAEWPVLAEVARLKLAAASVVSARAASASADGSDGAAPAGVEPALPVGA